MFNLVGSCVEFYGETGVEVGVEVDVEISVVGTVGHDVEARNRECEVNSNVARIKTKSWEHAYQLDLNASVT